MPGTLGAPWGRVAIAHQWTNHKDSERVVGSWQTRKGRSEGAMKSPLQMHVCIALVLRSWRCYDACLTTFATPRRSHRVPGQIAEPWRFFWTRSLATLTTTARCLAFPPRFYYAYGDLGALLAQGSVDAQSGLHPGLADNRLCLQSKSSAFLWHL